MGYSAAERQIFAKNLRFLRESLNMTQQLYAEHFIGKDGNKLKRTHIDSYENALSMPPEVLTQIATFHNLPEESLYTKDLTINRGITELTNYKPLDEGQDYHTSLLSAKDATIKAQAFMITVLERRVAELEQKLKTIA